MFHILAIASAISGAAGATAGSFLSNLKFKKFYSYIFFEYISVMFLLPVFYLLFREQIHLPAPDELPLYLVLGLIYAIHGVPYFFARRMTDNSKVSSLAMLGRITLPIFSFLLLAEKLDLIQYAGFVLIIAVLLWLNYDYSKANGKKVLLNPAFWVMLVGSLIGVFSVITEKALASQSGGWENAVFFGVLFKIMFVSAFLFFKQSRQKITDDFQIFRQKLWVFFVMSVFALAETIFGVWALSSISTVEKSSISALQPIFALLMSVFLIKVFHVKPKEKIDGRDIARKITGYTLLIIGVVIVSL